MGNPFSKPKGSKIELPKTQTVDKSAALKAEEDAAKARAQLAAGQTNLTQGGVTLLGGSTGKKTLLGA